MQNAISVTTALFDAKIAPSEVQYLRGNMIKMSDYSPLFHNHSAEGYRYAYPLIQYKRINGHIQTGYDFKELLFYGVAGMA
jgi:hypothetical protein